MSVLLVLCTGAPPSPPVDSAEHRGIGRGHRCGRPWTQGAATGCVCSKERREWAQAYVHRRVDGRAGACCQRLRLAIASRRRHRPSGGCTSRCRRQGPAAGLGVHGPTGSWTAGANGVAALTWSACKADGRSLTIPLERDLGPRSSGCFSAAGDLRKDFGKAGRPFTSCTDVCVCVYTSLAHKDCCHKG